MKIKNCRLMIYFKNFFASKLQYFFKLKSASLLTKAPYVKHISFLNFLIIFFPYFSCSIQTSILDFLNLKRLSNSSDIDTPASLDCGKNFSKFSRKIKLFHFHCNCTKKVNSNKLCSRNKSKQFKNYIPKYKIKTTVCSIKPQLNIF